MPGGLNPAPRQREIYVRHLGIKLTLFLFVALVTVVSMELAARAYWSLCCQVPFNKPGLVLYAYYPELRRVDQVRPRHHDKSYDILLLGGSVLNSGWGSVEKALHDQLTAIGQRKIRIFNLAVPAHTSRDSWLKYGALKKARFDLVIFYHGINETRANNAPPEIFREDYAHYSWYEIANALASYHRRKFCLALYHTLSRYPHATGAEKGSIRSDPYAPRRLGAIWEQPS